jgi:hypothetical protein
VQELEEMFNKFQIKISACQQGATQLQSLLKKKYKGELLKHDGEKDLKFGLQTLQKGNILKGFMKNSLLDSQQKEKVSRLIDQNDLLIEMNLRKLRFTQKALEKLNI